MDCKTGKMSENRLNDTTILCVKVQTVKVFPFILGISSKWVSNNRSNQSLTCIVYIYSILCTKLPLKCSKQYKHNWINIKNKSKTK